MSLVEDTSQWRPPTSTSIPDITIVATADEEIDMEIITNALPESSNSNSSSDGKTIEEQVAEIILESTEPNNSASSVASVSNKSVATNATTSSHKKSSASGTKKFSRIRGHVQHLNEQFLATLYETEQRHKAELEALTNEKEAELKLLTSKKEAVLEAMTNEKEAELKVTTDAKDESEKCHKAELEALTKEMEAAEQRHKAELTAFTEEKEAELAAFTEEKEAQLEALTKEMEATEQRHKAELTAFIEEKEAQLAAVTEEKEAELAAFTEEKEAELELISSEKEVLQCKVKTLSAQEEEHVILVKHAGERLQKLEAQDKNHKVYMQKAGEKISAMDARAKVMDAREGKVIELAKKAAIKIKSLEVRDKKHTSYAKKAAVNTQKLKQMLVGKHEELEGVSERALTELEVMAQELIKANIKVSATQQALDDVRRQHMDELKFRKAETLKISSLRRMIEQYDGGVDGCTWDGLSSAFSVEEPVTTVNLLEVYRAGLIESPSDICNRIAESIPENTKKNYNQVGFVKKNDHHYPVLALGPFDVAEGPLRDQWLENANHAMTGVYYYGQEDKSLAYDMILSEAFVPYSAGVLENFHIIPSDIIEKSLRTRGRGLSAMEAVYQAGIKMINQEARSAPEDRVHPQKANAADDLASIAGDASIVEATSESMMLKLKEKINIGVSGGKDKLLADLEEIQDTHDDEEELEKETVAKAPVVAPTVVPTVSAGNLSVEVSAPEATSATETSSESNEQSDEETLTSLEDQMQSFMDEISAAKPPSTPRTPRSVASSPRFESRESTGSIVDSTETPTDESREEIEQKASYETMQGSSLVKDRCKMFSGGQPTGKPPVSGAVSTGGGTKSVMQMWKNKTADSSTTPKCTNASTFSFNLTSKKTTISKVVAVPKNIQAKIDAGEELTDHEKEIMAGIQKFIKNSTPKANTNDGDVVINEMMSNVSAMTMDQSVTAE